LIRIIQCEKYGGCNTTLIYAFINYNTHTYINIYIHVYIYTYIAALSWCVCVRARARVCVCVWIGVCVCVCVCVCGWAFSNHYLLSITHTHINLYIHILLLHLECCLRTNSGDLEPAWSRHLPRYPPINHRGSLMYTLKSSWRKGQRNGSWLGRSAPIGHPYRGAIFLRHPL